MFTLCSGAGSSQVVGTGSFDVALIKTEATFWWCYSFYKHLGHGKVFMSWIIPWRSPRNPLLSRHVALSGICIICIKLHLFIADRLEHIWLFPCLKSFHQWVYFGIAAVKHLVKITFFGLLHELLCLQFNVPLLNKCVELKCNQIKLKLLLVFLFHCMNVSLASLLLPPPPKPRNWIQAGEGRIGCLFVSYCWHIQHNVLFSCFDD